MDDNQLEAHLKDTSKRIDPNLLMLFETYADLADKCNKELYKYEYIKEYRRKEKEGKSRITLAALQKKFDKYFEDGKNNYPGDLFYYPGKLTTEDSVGAEYFDNKLAGEYLEYLWTMNVMPVYYPRHTMEMRCYCMSMKKIFHLLSEKPYFLPDKTIMFLLHWLFQFNEKKEIMLHDLEKEESCRDRNRKNASTWTPKKIEEYKKHDGYPKLEQLIKTCQNIPTQTEVARVNRILSVILDTKNKVTLRRYRHIFFQEIKG
jgi:hypothetical protein